MLELVAVYSLVLVDMPLQLELVSTMLLLIYMMALFLQVVQNFMTYIVILVQQWMYMEELLQHHLELLIYANNIIKCHLYSEIYRWHFNYISKSHSFSLSSLFTCFSTSSKIQFSLSKSRIKFSSAPYQIFYKSTS